MATKVKMYKATEKAKWAVKRRTRLLDTPMNPNKEKITETTPKRNPPDNKAKMPSNVWITAIVTTQRAARLIIHNSTNVGSEVEEVTVIVSPCSTKGVYAFCCAIFFFRAKKDK